MTMLARLCTTLFLVLAFAAVAVAAPLKTHVNEFSVSGAPGRDDLKTTLQGLLASRLNPELVQLVEGRDKAELTIAGSYAQFGRMFSLDVQIKNMTSNALFRLFEQGEGQDDLLPAVGRLAGKIDRELAKRMPPAAAASAPAAAVVAQPLKAAATAPGQAAGYIQPAAAQDAYQITGDEGSRSAPGSWTSPPISGVYCGIAQGRTLGNGERELFVAGERSIRYYLKGAELRMVAEATIPNPAKILSIDTADLDGDGVPEIYATIYDRETLVSRVYLPKANGLELAAENLPWFFRAIGPDLKSRTVYTQEMVSGGAFSGEIATLAKTGNRFSTANRIKLPRDGFVFNFNRLTGAAGKGHVVVLDRDGYLQVSTAEGEAVWKSAVKYGGSENHFKVELLDQRRAFSDEFQWTFLEQRIVIAPDGTLLVPRNEGLFNIGNSRSYTKYSLHALHWNGSSLQEKWHTRVNQSYLADFAYDAAAKELILLEVVQKGDMFGKGKTVISINKVD